MQLGGGARSASRQAVAPCQACIASRASPTVPIRYTRFRLHQKRPNSIHGGEPRAPGVVSQRRRAFLRNRGGTRGRRLARGAGHARAYSRLGTASSAAACAAAAFPAWMVWRSPHIPVRDSAELLDNIAPGMPLLTRLPPVPACCLPVFRHHAACYDSSAGGHCPPAFALQAHAS